MSRYRVIFVRSAQKELASLTVEVASRTLVQIEALTIQPRPDGCKKLKGNLNRWRIRVGDYRVVYSIDDAEHIVKILIIRHRSQAYR